MRRIVIVTCLAAVLAILTIAYPHTANSAVQAPPTNTKRPTIPTLPSTNTPRPSATRAASPTRTPIPSKTRVPTKTSTPTRTPSPTRTPTLTPSVTPTTIGPINYPDNINPLTGLPYPDEAAANRRNIIVKVSNFPYIVRPQTGLSYADVVYEYEVEGSVTRFAAIFRSQGYEHVGSIRSGRLMDLELVPMYQALLAYSGSNDNIKTMILQGSCINKETGSRELCQPDLADA